MFLKTESMCVDALWRASTNRSYVCLFCCPYENQVRLIMGRISELIALSPLVSKEVISNTKNPFQILFKNGSKIVAFTTGASSSTGGASIRGQRSDMIYLDESDYMQDADFDNILMLAAERPGIGVFLSSTPTGARKRFWQCCTDPKLGFKEFHYPSMCNPDWGPAMEEEFRAQLSENGYIHEVLADFGAQETGVFDKVKLDNAMNIFDYYYNNLTNSQMRHIKEDGRQPESYLVPEDYKGIYRHNVFRTMGVDWDKILQKLQLNKKIA